MKKRIVLAILITLAVLSLAALTLSACAVKLVDVTVSGGKNEVYLDEFQLSDYTIEASYSDGTTTRRQLSDEFISPADLAKLTEAGTHTITVTFEGVSVRFTVTLLQRPAHSATMSPQSFVYDGTAHSLQVQGLPQDATVVYQNNGKVNAGVYDVTATVTYSDSTTQTLTAKLTIEKADYDLENITFEGETVTYNGEPHSLKIKGDLPEGVDVSYTGNGMTNAGEHTVTAVFTGDTVNHNPIPSKTAVLKIEKADYDLSEVTFEGETVTYNGEPHSLKIQGDLPEGVEVSYTGNNVTDAGEHTVTAVFTGDTVNHNPIPSKTAVLKIEKADYDLDDITFEGETVTYNGEPHSLAIKGQLPSDVDVSYTGNNVTEIGEHQVTANFTGDTVNHNPIPSKTAVLKIVQPQYSEIKFQDKTVTYNGEPQYLAIEGNLVYGVQVRYENNGQTNVGEYDVKAIFTVPQGYEPLPTLTAKLTIEKADYNLADITFEGGTFAYDGEPHSLKIKGDLPKGVEVSYTGNNVTEVGEHQITANFTGDAVNHNPIPSKTAVLTITKRELQVVLDGETVIQYDGKPHNNFTAHATNLVGDETVQISLAYSGNMTDEGTYTVTATIAEHPHYTLTQGNTFQVVIDRQVHTVTFRQDGQPDQTVKVPHLGSISAEQMPKPVQLNDGYTYFWQQTELSNVADDMTVLADRSPIVYTVTYQTYGGDNPQTNLTQYTVETPLTPLANPTKGETIFGGWYLNEQFSGAPVQQIGGGMMGNLTLHAYWIEFNVLSVEGFTINEDAEVPTITGEFHNAVTQIDLVNRVVVNNGCVWKLYQDFEGKHEYPLKAMTLTEGHNKAYIIVSHPDGFHFKRYELDVYRMYMRTYRFENLGANYNSGSIEERSAVSAPDSPTRTGYIFDGWTLQGSDSVVQFPYTVNEDTVFTAKYTIINYDITYHLNDEFLDGSFPAQHSNVESYTVEQLVTLSNATRDHYKFEGWFKEPTFDTQVTELPVGSHENIDLYAKWTAVEYTITYHLNDEFLESTFPAQNPNAETTSYTVESTITLQSATRTAFNFVGWYSEQELQTEVAQLPLGTFGNKDFYAKWTAIEYTITYHLNDDFLDSRFPAVNSDNTVTYTAEGAVTFSNATREHYNFVGWYKEASFDTHVTELPVGTYDDVELYAKWTAVEYNVTYYLNDGTYSNKFPAQNENSATYTVESGLTLQPATRTAFNFVAWYSDSELQTEVVQLPIGTFGNKDFYAKWTAIEYTITYHLSDEEWVNEPAIENDNDVFTYTAEQSVTFSNPTHPHYTFKGWYTELTFDTQVTTLSEGSYGNVDLYAKWWYGTDGLVYSEQGDDYQVTGYTGSSTSVAIPNVWDGRNVTSIGDSAFSSCSSLQEITIPASVMSIGSSAFEECSCLNKVNITDIDAWCNIDFGSYDANPLYYAKNLYLNDELVTEANLEKATKIGSYAFCGYDKLTKVTIPANVTSIGEYAFYNCSNLQEITIPEKVTSIGSRAFYNCESLQEITIPANVTSIGDNAFANCTNLAIVNWNATNCTSVGKYSSSNDYTIFKGCTNLKTVNVGANVTSIPAYTFYHCSSLQEITIPANVTTIGNSAFSGCSSLQEITIPEKVTSIGSDAFSGCSNLATVTFADGSLLETIGSNAFEYCSLQEITIPANVTSIGNNAFANCTNLATVNWNAINCTTVGAYSSSNDYTIFKGCTSLKTVNVGANVTSIPAYAFYDCEMTKVSFAEGSLLKTIGSYAFEYCSSLQEITIPANVTSIGDYAVNNCSNLATVNWNATNCTSAGSSIFKGCTSLKTVNVGANVTSIPAYAFYDCEMTKVSFAEGSLLKTIGSYAFEYCSSLQEITIPDNVTSIGNNAFANCTNLATVNWNATNCTSVGQYESYSKDYTIFKGCTSLKTVNVGANVTSIPVYAFYNCEMTMVTFAEGSLLKTIGDYAFRNCSSLQEITIPASVTSIGGSAFYGCSSLKRVDITDIDAWCNIGFGSWDANPLPYAENLYLNDELVTEAKLDKTTKIGSYAFYSYSKLTKVTIPASVTSIGDNAFYLCTKLATVNWNATNCTSVGKCSSSKDYTIFKGCTSLATVNIGANVTSIPSYAFYNCSGLQEITIPASVTSIGGYAFCRCTGLQEITIPASVTSIGNYAFNNCISLTIYCEAAYKPSNWYSDWNDSKRPVVWDCLKNDVATDGYIYVVADGVRYALKDNKATVVRSSAYRGSIIILSSVEFKDKQYPVTAIEEKAFYECSSLQEITISESVTSIGEYAFYRCSKLATVTFADGSLLETIGESAFYECSSLREITIPASVTSIGSSAFSGGNASFGCRSLTTVTFADGSLLETIGEYAFYNCSSLREITIPANVTSIGRWAFSGMDAFSGCSSLTTVTFADGSLLKNIGEYAFCYCSSLTTVTFADGSLLKNIGEYAFCDCSRLQQITIPASVTLIGKKAFNNCNRLKIYCEASEKPFSWDSAWNDSKRPVVWDCLKNDVATDGYIYVIADGVRYALKNNMATAELGLESNVSITIPSSVEYKGKQYSVTAIEEKAFYECSSLQEITIPESVTSIGSSAFYGCSNLTTVTFADGSLLETVGSNAFDGCSSLNKVNITNIDAWCNIDFGSSSANPLSNKAELYLNGDLVTNVTIPSETTQVKPYIFYNCTSLQEITIPANVTSIGDNAFANCTNLATVNWNATNCTSVGKYELSWADYTIFKGCTNLATVNIGSNVTAIPSYAFYGCSNFAVQFSEGCQLDTLSAFYQLSGLQSLNNIPASVTSIDSNAFYGCSNLTTVTFAEGCQLDSISEFYGLEGLQSLNNIPANVTSIGEDAFRGCSNLVTVTFADGSLLKTIGDYVFSGCSSLQEITIPANVTSIGNNAFANCTKLATVNWNATNCTSVGKYSSSNDYTIFKGCTSLATVNVGANVTSIPAYAFYSCKMTMVTFAEGRLLQTIGENAFSYCSSLQEITIPANVTSIGDYVFSGCSSLQEITIPANVTSIGEDAFRGCSNLVTVTFADGSLLETIGSNAFEYCSLQEITIPANVTSIGDYVFSGCSSLQEITIPANVTSIGGSAFSGCSSLQEITIPENVTTIGNRAFYNCSNLATVNWNATNCTSAGSSSSYAIFSGCTSLATVNVGANVTSIPAYAFYNCESLQEITIPASVTSIGSSAFSGCSNLTTVTFADGSLLETIGGSAFYNCSSLQKITIPANVTSIGNNAFESCRNLATVNWNATNCTSVGTYGSYNYTIFYGCISLATVNIGANVTSIPAYAFYNCSNLATVTFADGSLLQTIGSSAFRYCSSLQEITIPANVKSIGDYAFYYCSNLTTVTFAEGCQLSSISAFYGLEGLQSLNNIPVGVKSIENKAFSGCSNLTTVTFAEGCQLDSISAFYGLKGLQSLNNIPANVTTIGYSAFYGCSNLTTVTFADGSLLETIGGRAFYNCTSLQEITIPENVTSISSNAFDGCSNLTTVTFAEGCLLDSISAFYGLKGLQSLNNIPVGITSIDSGAFRDCSNLTTVTFADGSLLETIGGGSYYDGAFYGCSSLQEITIPANVTSIGSWAFYGCSSLNKVNITDIDAWCNIDFGNEYANPLYYAKNLYLNDELVTEAKLDKTTKIGILAFYGCDKLTKVTIPANVTSIGSGAFRGCSSLREITIPANVTSIGNYAFEGCSKLVTVTFAYGSLLETIGYDAFYNCESLQEITIPASVTSIGYGAFSRCSNLATVTFADDSLLETIGGGGSYSYYGAFYNCISLQEITIPANVTSIGNYAFEGCSNLTTVTFADGSLLETIGYRAFYECSSLKTVYYGGSQTQWGSITIESNNSYLTNATRYYYSADKPDGSELPVGSYWRYVDGKPTVWKEEDQ